MPALLETISKEWLQVQRIENVPKHPIRGTSWSALSGRTKTRAHAGFPRIRWEDGLDEAKEAAELLAKLLKSKRRKNASLHFKREIATLRFSS